MSDRELIWLRRLLQLSNGLAREPDLDSLLARVLASAVELTDAERGFLVRLKPGEGAAQRINVEVALGFDGKSLSGAAGTVSRTVVQRVLDEDRSVITAREEDGDIVDISSVRSQRVRSVACVPMRLRGTIIGVIYLDNSRIEGAFTERDVPCLEAFCDHAALTLETAELTAARDAHAQQLNQALREIEALNRPGAPALPTPDRIPRFGRLVGGSTPMLRLYRLIEQAARSESPVLLVGETGAGKALVAREIHQRSTRKNAPFVSQACTGATPERLSEELWGLGRGVLSGILDAHPGAFERAGAGTLLLSDLGDLTLDQQGKLVDTLRNRTTVPVGEEASRPVVSRLIASTRHDPQALVQGGHLREDLYCLLEIGRIDVPPLREHAEDVPALLSAAFHGASAELAIASPALDHLVDHSWPGNVRELQNLAVRLLGSKRSNDPVEVQDLPPEVRAERPTFDRKTLEEVRCELIQAALEETGGSRTQAAKRLGIPRSTFYRLLEKFDLA